MPASIGLAALFTAALLTASLHAQSPTSRFYGDHTLQLVAAPNGSFTAHFYDETQAGKFSCGFLLHSEGHPSTRNVYRITTWWPARELNGDDVEDEVVPRTLTVSPTGLILQLPKQAHGGCWNVNFDLDQGNPVDLDRDKDTPSSFPTWQTLRVVKSPRVSLRPQPDPTTNTRPYIVRGDVIFVTATQASWLHVIYCAAMGTKTFTGWLQESDLLPARIP
jgi:hypothetical protein